jgi:hypothetical protein
MNTDHHILKKIVLNHYYNLVVNNVINIPKIKLEINFYISHQLYFTRKQVGFDKHSAYRINFLNYDNGKA